jgi:hypothetical protein
MRTPTASEGNQRNGRDSAASDHDLFNGATMPVRINPENSFDPGWVHSRQHGQESRDACKNNFKPE